MRLTRSTTRVNAWRRYYRYAWKDKGPNGILYSSDTQIIQEGKLACNSYAYSGQNSFALVGAGMFFIPEYGNAKISIRPYVQWQTTASFTGTESAPASAAAFLGIWVESWKRSGGGVQCRSRPIHSGMVAEHHELHD